MVEVVAQRTVLLALKGAEVGERGGEVRGHRASAELSDRKARELAKQEEDSVLAVRELGVGHVEADHLGQGVLLVLKVEFEMSE